MSEAAPNPANSSPGSAGSSSSLTGSGSADNKGPVDAELLTRTGQGDITAMEAIFDRYAQSVYSVALRVLGEPGGAESVMQSVFLNLWRDPCSFPERRSSLGAWLVVAARNRAVERRRALPAAELPEEVVLASPCDLSTAAERRNAADKINKALEELPRQSRSTLEMVFFEGLTQSEIATRGGDSPATVKIRIQLALTEIRKATLA